MANKDLGSASVGVEIDLKELQGQLRTAANMIGNVTNQASKKASGQTTKGGLFGQIIGGTNDAGFNLSLLSNFSGSLGRVGTAASGVSRVLGGVAAAGAAGAAAMTGVGLAIAAVIAVVGGAILVFKGFQAAVQGVFATIQSAGNLQQTETTFEVLRKNMGVSTAVTDQYREALEKMNYVGAEQTQIMSGLLQSNVGLNDTTLQAVTAMRDLSVAAGVASTQGIGTMNQAITTLNPQLLQNYGITQTATQVFDTYGASLGKTSQTMTDAEKRQAILNAVIAQGARSAGAADAAQGNLNRTVTQLKANFETLKAGIGQVFLPLASGIVSLVNSEIFGLSKSVDENRGRFESMGQTLASKVIPMVQGFINWIKSIPWVGIIDGIYRTIQAFSLLAQIAMIPAKVIWAAFRIVGQVLATVGVVLDRVGSGFATLGKIAAAAWDVITGKSSLSGFVSNVQSAFTQYSTETGNLLGALGDSWGDLFGELGNDATSTINGILKTAENLKNGFDIGKWFESLPNAVAKGGDDALKAAADTAGGISAGALKALRKMQEEMDKENEQYARKQAQAAQEYQQQLAEMVATHRDQIASIRKDITKEQKTYEKAYAQRTRDYQDELNKLNRADDDRKKDVQTQIAEETAKGRFADQTKLASLRSRLAYEDAAHKQAVAQAESAYQTDTENAAASHQERLDELSTNLDKELAIQARYASDFNAFRDYQIKDDITKLKEQYAQRSAEDARAHQERLADIIKQGTEEASQQQANGLNSGAAAMNGLSSGILGGMGDAKNAANRAGRESGDSTKQGIDQKGGAVKGSFRDVLVGAALGAGVGSIFGPVGTLIGAVVGGKIGETWPGIKNALGEMLRKATEQFGVSPTWARDFVGKLGQGLAGAWGKARQGFVDGWKAMGLPGFATGGIVGGRHGTDNNIAQVSRGEMILNRDQQQRMFNMLDGRVDTSGNNSNAGMIIENLTVQLPNVRNASDFERDLKLKFTTMRTL